MLTGLISAPWFPIPNLMRALVCNVLAWKNQSYPRYLGAIGILGGGAYLLTCLGSVVEMQQLVDVAVGLGGLILAPIWYVGFGIVMRTWSRS